MPTIQLNDEASFATNPRDEKKSLRFGIAALIVSIVVIANFDWPAFFSDVRPHGERKQTVSGRDFLRETDVQQSPQPSALTRGWDSERVWSGHDDWEPFLATDHSSSFVYQMVTRFNSTASGISSAVPLTAVQPGCRINW
jgi:hypothetical protein